MNEQANYQGWKPTVLGRPLTAAGGVTDPYGVQCVVLAWNYASHLFPSVSIADTITLGNADTLFKNASTKYFQKMPYDPTHKQLPQQGDIMVFGATPAKGYTNQYDNPYGHVGVCNSASTNGYALLQQNSPQENESVNITSYAWTYRPCVGWLRPISQGVGAPAPAPTVPTITLPKTTGPWHLYRVGGPYDPSNAGDVLGVIDPTAFHEDLTYKIIQNLGNGVYVIDSEDYGRGALWTQGSNVVIK